MNDTLLVSRDLLDRARGEIGRGEYERAREILTPLADPDARPGERERAMDFWRDAAEVLRDAGWSEASERCWERAGENGLPAMVVRIQSLTTRVAEGRFEPAVEGFRELSESEPNNGTIRNLYAIALFESGARAEALEQWEATLKISAQHRCPLSTNPLYLSLGTMALEGFLAGSGESLESEKAKGGNIEDENEGGGKGAERAPGRTAGGRLARIEGAIEERRFDRALRWIDAEPRGEKDPPGLLNMYRSLALAETGRWSEAREELSAVLEDATPNPSAQCYLAQCLTRSGEPGVALALLDTVAAAGPDDYFKNYFSGCALLATGDRLGALHTFRRAFTEYFYDTYHYVLLPAWEKTVERVRGAEESTKT